MVNLLGLFGQLGHGGLNHGANAVAGQLQALAQAALQRPVHRLRQPCVSRLHLRVEALLVGQQTLIHLLAGFGHLHHHVLQLFNHLGQGLRLLLQRLVGFLPLVRE